MYFDVRIYSVVLISMLKFYYVMRYYLSVYYFKILVITHIIQKVVIYIINFKVNEL